MHVYIYGGAPNVSLADMSLSGEFSQGATESLTRMAKIKFPTPISSGSLSYLPARQRWMDLEHANYSAKCARELW